MNTPQRVDVERLSELLSRATPGPYEAVESDNGFACIGTVKADASGGKGFIVGEAWSMADAEYVAAALNALPALLQQLAEAERAREEACGLLRDIRPVLSCADTYGACGDLRDRIAAFLAANGGRDEA